MIVGLVGCGKAKLEGTHRARDLYVGNLFRASLQAAEQIADVVYVLSAKHGLVQLEQPIASYDLQLSKLPVAERLQWGRRVIKQLLELHGGAPFSVVAFAGAAYLYPIRVYLEPHITVRDPLAGLELGERLQALKAGVS